MGNEEAQRNLSLYTQHNKKHQKDFLILIEEAKRLSSKGIYISNKLNGKLNFFKEKPSISEILLELSSIGSLNENIMYIAIRDHHLNSLFQSFSNIPSKSYPGKEIRKSINFGFFSVLISMSLMENEWEESWISILPSDLLNNRDKIDLNEIKNNWLEDGRTLQKIAKKWISDKEIYVANFGEKEIVEDFGEPRYYLHAILNRSFTAKGRELAHLPPLYINYINSFHSNVHCVNTENLMIINSVIEGKGTLLIRNQCFRVVLSHCFISIPDGEELIIGNSLLDDKEIRLDNLILLESCYITHGGVIDGDFGILVGLDISLNQEITTITHSSTHTSKIINNFYIPNNHITTTISLRITNHKEKINCNNEFDEKEGIFSIDIDENVNRKNDKGDSILSQKILWGLDFFQSLCSIDINRMTQRQKNIDLHLLQMNEKLRIGVFSNSSHIFQYLCDKNSADFQKKIGKKISSNTLNAPNPIIDTIIEEFTDLYGSKPDLICSSPGRINAGGAHTDWSYHRVIGMAISRRTFVAIKLTNEIENSDENSVIKVFSKHAPISSPISEKNNDNNLMNEKWRIQNINIPLHQTIPKIEGSWSNYVMGVINELRSLGIKVPPMEMYISSDVQQGTGLSSSAALIVSVTLSIIQILQLDLSNYLTSFRHNNHESEYNNENNNNNNNNTNNLDEKELKYLMAIVKLANIVENKYVGIQSGILDQCCSTFGKPESYIVIDCKKNSPSLIATLKSPLSNCGYSVVVIDTGTTRLLSSQTHHNNDEFLHSIRKQELLYSQFKNNEIGNLNSTEKIESDHESNIEGRNFCSNWKENMKKILTKNISEMDILKFNKRVNRYWSVVSLLSNLPVLPNKQKIQFDPSSPTLKITFNQLQDIKKRFPEFMIVIEIKNEFSINTYSRTIPENKSPTEYVIELFGKENFMTENQIEFCNENCLPIIMKNTVNNGIINDCDEQFSYIGIISIEYADKLLENSEIHLSEIIPTKYGLGVAEYMIKEDMRVQAIQLLLTVIDSNGVINNKEKELVDNEEECDTLIYDKEHEELRSTVTKWIEEHSEKYNQVGMFKRYHFERKIANKLRNLKRLFPFEICLIQGILGDQSWKDKKELFKGDSKWGTLQTAYDYVDLFECIIYQKFEEEFFYLGKLCPGAGFAGMISVYLRTTNCPFDYSSCLLRIFKGEKNDSNKWMDEYLNESCLNNIAISADINRESFTKNGDFVSYAEHLRQHVDLDPEKIGIWVDSPSNGAQIDYCSPGN